MKLKDWLQRETEMPQAVALFLVLGLLSWGGITWQENLELKKKLGKVEADLNFTKNNLQQLKNENFNLLGNLTIEREKGETLAEQVRQIADNVGTLTKLSQTDKELLQKYSKIYFLNENYIPARLSEIDQKYLFNKNKVEQIHTDILPFLEKLLLAAEKENVPILIISAYRSFGTQATLKTNYKMTYGSGANKFSADQGYSEHQLGSALDFTTLNLGSGFTKFAKSPAYEWLLANAYKYGFILSYPLQNTYYQFEPWHWRFVGVELATRLHNENKTFYYTSQREINNYLVKIFDK